MAYENLLKSVEESAQEKERELREKARITIQEISDDTKNQETMIQQSLLAEAKKAALIEKNKLIYLTKNENKTKNDQYQGNNFFESIWRSRTAVVTHEKRSELSCHL